MNGIKLLKMISVVLVFVFVINVPALSYGGRYFFNADTNGNSKQVNLGYKLKFGPAEEAKQREDLIAKLKQEDTGGAGTMIALLVLGGCIVAAAIILANKADDVVDSAEDKADEIQADLDEKYDETINEYGDTIDELRDEYNNNQDEIDELREEYEETNSLQSTGLFQ